MDPEIAKLIDQLSLVDLEMIQRPRKHAVLEVTESIFGETKESKKREKERLKVLLNKKCMLINACPLPENPQTLASLTNLCLSSYKTAETEMEKEAWRNKMRTSLHRLQVSISTAEGELVADDYLFLNAEYEKISGIEHVPTRKRSFFDIFRR
ncbi:hypothetical protein [Fulvitalea axinellae]